MVIDVQTYDWGDSLLLGLWLGVWMDGDLWEHVVEQSDGLMARK